MRATAERCCLLAILALAAVLPASAQIRASERGSVSQVVDGTTITVDYARPRVRGRSPVFGRLVHWGEVWTPGANMATTLEVSADVEVGGRPLPRGKYSLWLVVDRGEQWTLVLDPDWSRFHTVRPRESTSQVRFAVDVGTAPPTEVLTFDFPEVTSTGTVLRFAWDDRLIRLPIAVRPATSLTMPAAEAAPYVGSWELASAGRESAPSRRFDVSHEKGSLRVHIDPPLWPGGSRLFLIRRGPGVFMLGEEQNGRLADVMSEWSIEFGSGAEEGTFEVRDVAERLIARGSRRSRGSAD